MNTQRNSNEASIKELLDFLMQEYKIDKKIDSIRIKQEWRKIMGGTIANRTKNIYVKKNVLFLEIDSAPLKNELLYAKDKIVKLINDAFNKEIIEKVIII